MNTASALNPELVAALKRLRLGRITETLPERLVLADKQEMAFDELLPLVLTDEIARRENTAADNRASEARLEPGMRLELWDKTAKVTFDKRVLAELASLRFLEAHRHVVVLGPVGVGKTFIAQALGHIACRHGCRVRFTRADEMLRRLRQSRFDNSRDAEMVALSSVDLLILDDFAASAILAPRHLVEHGGRKIIGQRFDVRPAFLWLGLGQALRPRRSSGSRRAPRTPRSPRPRPERWPAPR
jgi:DNA replication protein DnaC